MITMEWSGPVEQLPRVVAKLAHLDPTPVEGTPVVALHVTAATVQDAADYVRKVLHREELSRWARVL